MEKKHSYDSARETWHTLERSMARRYHRQQLARYLPEAALDPRFPFVGIKPEYMRDDPAITQAVVRKLGHRLHRIVRARVKREPWATSLSPAFIFNLRAALFGEAMILRRQRAANAQVEALNGLQVILDHAMSGDAA